MSGLSCLSKLDEREPIKKQIFKSQLRERFPVNFFRFHGRRAKLSESIEFASIALASQVYELLVVD